MKPSVDRDLCISCGLCETICEQVFQLDDECVATPIVDEVPAKQESTVARAIKQCPVNAITVE